MHYFLADDALRTLYTVSLYDVTITANQWRTPEINGIDPSTWTGVTTSGGVYNFDAVYLFFGSSGPPEVNLHLDNILLRPE